MRSVNAPSGGAGGGGKDLPEPRRCASSLRRDGASRSVLGLGPAGGRYFVAAVVLAAVLVVLALV